MVFFFELADLNLKKLINTLIIYIQSNNNVCCTCCTVSLLWVIVIKYYSHDYRSACKWLRYYRHTKKKKRKKIHANVFKKKIVKCCKIITRYSTCIRIWIGHNPPALHGMCTRTRKNDLFNSINHFLRLTAKNSTHGVIHGRSSVSNH